MDLNESFQEKQLVTKEGIYKYISDVDIYHRYGKGLKVEIRGNYKSPFRDDKSPSFGFFVGKDEICFKDFLLGSGGPIDFVMMMFNLDYVSAMSKIIIDFEIEKHFLYKKINMPANVISIDSSNREEIISNAPSRTIRIKSRDWKIKDKKYWTQFGISLNTLRSYNVVPIDYIFLGDNTIKADDVAYAYIERKDGKETYKIYQPYSEKLKWINNHDYSTWQGWTQLPETGSKLIITKSLKDAMCLLDVFGVPAISLQAESVMPKDHIIDELKSRFRHIYLLYDNDYDKEENWGQILVAKLKDKFDIDNVLIASGWESKDFSDLVKNHGSEKACEILEQEINNILPF